ncbi:MAG TPA: LLM class flavin-dependent oxidoreductase [Dehalococcoidia bacterium]|nr:LLM class flavin-dependent oxidoreductase [Dehalococcoidia bacterium]
MLTKSGLRLGISLPGVFPGDRVDTDLVRAFAARAESLGYEDLWLTESIVGGQGTLEPVTLLAYAAACTRRIRLGVSVIILNYRQPVQLAKAVATLDQLSGGRVTVGVGLGNSTAAYPAFGIGAERPVARFTESLTIMKALWTEQQVRLKGEFWQLEDVSVSPKPVQQPHPPVWMGGHAPAALRRAVRLADGWMGAGGARNADFFTQIAQIRAYMKELGRDEGSFPLSKRVYIAVDHDEDHARERLNAGMTRQYGRAPAGEGAGVAGTPGQCIEILRSLRDAGLQHLLLHPFADSLQQLELLTTEVAPEL